jgi:hypothetical protein
LCGTIPDPRPAIDSKLKLLDEALNDLEMGEGNKFLALRGSLLDAQGHVRTDIFKPRGDIHLNSSGTQIVSLGIQRMLEVMLPNLVQTSVQTPPAPVQTTAKVQRARVQAPVPDPAPVVVNEPPPVVNTPLVAAPVVNAPAVAQAHAGVQQLVGQIQDLVVQHVAVVETPMEVEDEDTLLQRLFFKRFGRALPEKEKEKEKDDVDGIDMNLIDLTQEDDEMEVAAPVVVVKTEPIEAAEAPEVAAKQRRASRRLELIELARARKAITEFGKSLRKTEVIQEKEAPLAASSNVIADTDTNMSEDVSVNPESVVTTNSKQTIAEAEAAIAEWDAAIAANQKAIDEFDD